VIVPSVRFTWTTSVISVMPNCTRAVWEVPAETVEFPHHQRVAFTERLQARGKPGAIVALSGGAILIQVLPIDASSHKRVHLQVENL
jgi:hypothetical protein